MTAQKHDDLDTGDRVTGCWRPVADLPPASDADDEVRCVVVWQDRDHPLDRGAEICTLSMIRDGDYSEHRMVNAAWRSLMDAPAMVAGNAEHQARCQASPECSCSTNGGCNE